MLRRKFAAQLEGVGKIKKVIKSVMENLKKGKNHIELKLHFKEKIP